MSRSSNSPRYLAPATSAPRSSETTLAVAKALGDVAADDPLGQALDDGGLADAGLADQDRVVLGAAGEHLDDAADLVVAADHRVELALARRRSVRSRPYFSSAWYVLLGVLVGDPLRTADLGDRGLERRLVGTGHVERVGSPAARGREAEQATARRR